MDEREQNMIRLGCLRDAVQTVDIEQRTGYFDVVGCTEDVPTRVNLYYQKYLEIILEGRNKPEGFQSPQPQRKPAVEISVTPDKPPIQSQIVHTETKKYSDVHCVDCDRKLTVKELDFVNKTGREKICYQCDKKRKESGENEDYSNEDKY